MVNMENRLINGKDFICLNVMPKPKKHNPKNLLLWSESIYCTLQVFLISFVECEWNDFSMCIVETIDEFNRLIGMMRGLKDKYDEYVPCLCYSILAHNVNNEQATTNRDVKTNSNANYFVVTIRTMYKRQTLTVLDTVVTGEWKMRSVKLY